MIEAGRRHITLFSENKKEEFLHHRPNKVIGLPVFEKINFWRSRFQPFYNDQGRINPDLSDWTRCVCRSLLLGWAILAGAVTQAGAAEQAAPVATRMAGVNKAAVPQLVLPPEMAQKIGRKIWLNEAGGNRNAITSWNANEGFASLGIGHFIWFPPGRTPPFEESFPGLIAFLRDRHVHVPAWLDKNPVPACPWISRADFKRRFNSPEMRQLRQLLLATVTEQTQFLVARAQGAMDKILANTPNSEERAHIIAQFSRIARSSGDLYPLIDYINFKGEGINPAETALDRETGRRQGWGFKQVLLAMTGNADDPAAVRAEFADAAQAVLQQRVRNLPSNRMWETGWLRRVETYRHPI